MQNTGGRRRRQVNRSVIRFRVETEYVRFRPHIVTLRPTQIQNATPQQVAMWVVRRLRDATMAEVRRYYRTIGRRLRLEVEQIEVVLTWIFNFNSRNQH